MMKTNWEINQVEKIAKKLNQEPQNIIIGDYEHRENYKGDKLQGGYSVYVRGNQGVNGSQVDEFAGWIINDRYYKQNRG